MISRLSSVAIVASLFVVAACKKEEASPPSPASPTGTTTAAAAYKRSSVTCAEIIAGLRDGIGKETVTPGSWGKAPKALQVLPPGAELCGAGAATKTPVIKSELFGDALGAFYKPVTAGMGCTWSGVEVLGDERVKITHVNFKCPDKAGGTSMVHTDSASEFYYLSY